ncbi:hypothetical protein [Nitrosococcus halophilus]|uniref:hypothetical protein n=1 Tax=Nitrosococcus halophilus TaxID=133539 RepID=UPI0002D6FA31|nr:hypothetical protein [Nitrosococcus halophilus]
MELIEITEQGLPARAIEDFPEIAMEVMHSTAKQYKKTGYKPPWIGYLAIEEGKCVGNMCIQDTPTEQRNRNCLLHIS